MQFTNSLSRKKEDFKPLKDLEVGIYSCGPTVYHTASIGNFRAFLFADFVHRLFEFDGYKIKHVMNITDVGHLTDDGSDGDDKMEKAAAKEGKTAWDIAEFYTNQFLTDMDRLNIKRPDVMPKATDHIEQQIKMVGELEGNGYTYKTSDGIYFDTSKLDDYGKLSNQKLEDKEEGARVQVNKEKKNSSDFALWKFSKEGEKRQMEWESPWGVGFPGWHIECSAMSIEYLGSPFDIHTGGMDLGPVHHENEIAQTQGVYKNNQSNYWLHNEFILIDGGKMSKSLNNVYSIDDLIERGIDPLAFRYFTLGAHYRSPINFTWEAVDAAQNALNNLRDAIWMHFAAPTESDNIAIQRFRDKLHDDLDTPGALAVLWDVAKDKEMNWSTKLATLFEMDGFLGFNLDGELRAAQEAGAREDVQAILDKRKDARAQKDFDASDSLRDELKALGLVVEDHPKGQLLRPVR
ncbi:cysteine--tRNA ligase [Candidatus Uhrbacteria bacterium]|nr:cysteine--tRNA ligase [Candidatus Uhrbacteria bacterium]